MRCLHRGLEIRWIDGPSGRGEKDVASGLFGTGGILLERTRVGAKIGPSVELDWIDEDGNDDQIVLLPRSLDEGQVACVEGSHRGDKPNPLALPLRLSDEARQFR